MLTGVAVAVVVAVVCRAAADVVCCGRLVVVLLGDGVAVVRVVVLVRGLEVGLRLGVTEAAGARADRVGRTVPVGDASERVGFALPPSFPVASVAPPSPLS